MAVLESITATNALAAIAVVAFVQFAIKLHKARMLAREVADKYGVPILPHWYLFGHFPVIVKSMMRYPSDMFGASLAIVLLEDHPEFNDVGAFYIDLWPVSCPMVHIFHPGLLSQYPSSLQKADMVKAEFRPWTGNKDVVTSEGTQWRRWRSLLNPGFSAKNVMSMVPDFLEEIRVFKGVLQKHADMGDVFRLEDPTINLSIDIIGRAALGTRLHCQTTTNPLQARLVNQISWLIPTWELNGFLKLINPYRPLAMYLNNRFFRNFFLPFLHQSAHSALHPTSAPSGTKTITSLAVSAHLASLPDSPPTLPTPSTPVLPPTFLTEASHQLTIFLFAGHDTTAVTLCFAYHLLHRNPRALALVRAELDAVLGPPGPQAEVRVEARPQLLNALPYTSAVVKETLRLFPPVGGVRQGQEGFLMRHPDTGRVMPTGRWMLFAPAVAVQRWERFWEKPRGFRPERFLPGGVQCGEEGRRDAYRPFELGMRSCMGQELALVELRMVLALTVREFEVESWYGEGGREVWGDRAYQVMLKGQITGHPNGGMPVRVRRREV